MAQAPIHHADIVRKVGSLALSDAVEITILIDLIKKQNADGVNAALTKAGAGRAGAVLQNSMIARLVTIVARAYLRRIQPGAAGVEILQIGKSPGRC